MPILHGTVFAATPECHDCHWFWCIFPTCQVKQHQHADQLTHSVCCVWAVILPCASRAAADILHIICMAMKSVSKAPVSPCEAMLHKCVRCVCYDQQSYKRHCQQCSDCITTTLLQPSFAFTTCSIRVFAQSNLNKCLFRM